MRAPPFRLTIIHPCVGRRVGQRGYIRTWKMEPLPAATIAALTPADVEKRFYDDRLEPIPFDEPTDLVAISVETYTARRAYQIASEYRRRRVPVVMGGFHAALCPDEVSRYADAVVIGEAEELFPLMLDDWRHGRSSHVYRAEVRPRSLRVAPDRSIFRGKRYLPIRLVETLRARGCRFACEFCAITAVFTATQVRALIERVLTEVRALRRPGLLFFFIDDNIVSDLAGAEGDCSRALAGEGIRWVGQASSTVACDEECLELMRACGCQGLLIGFESLGAEQLGQMNKGWNLARGGPSAAMATLRRHGIRVYGTFIFGYDHDDAASFARSVGFARDEGMFIAAFNHLTPFPGDPALRSPQGGGAAALPGMVAGPGLPLWHGAVHPAWHAGGGARAALQRGATSLLRLGQHLRARPGAGEPPRSVDAAQFPRHQRHAPRRRGRAQPYAARRRRVDRGTAARVMNGGARAAPALRIALAQPGDAMAIAALLATPLPGALRLVLAAPASACAPHRSAEIRHHAVVVRTPQDEVLGHGARTVRRLRGAAGWVWTGYLHGLRRSEALRGDGRRLAAALRELQATRAEAECDHDLTAILAANQRARRVLEGGVPGAPAYHHLGDYRTLVVAAAGAARWRAGGIILRPGLEGAGDEVRAMIARQAGGYALAADLGAAGWWTAWRGVRLVGAVRAVDRRAEQVAAVAGYAPGLGLVRPLLNLAWRCTGRPTLPAPGADLDLVHAAHLTVPAGDPAVVRALLAAVARTRGAARVAWGLGEGHQLRPALERLPGWRIDSRLYAVGGAQHAAAPAASPESAWL